MAEIALITTVPDINDRPFGYGSTNVISEWWTANTSEEVKYFMAPSGGILKAVYVSAIVTSDATKTYTFTVKNLSNTDAAMIGTTLYDADPVLTADTVATVTLSATAANLAVDRGDLIEVAMTGGTGSGAAAIQLVFETA